MGVAEPMHPVEQEVEDDEDRQPRGPSGGEYEPGSREDPIVELERSNADPQSGQPQAGVALQIRRELIDERCPTRPGLPSRAELWPS